MTTTEIKTLLREGAELHIAGKLSEAESIYRQALEINEEHAVAHNNLGFLLSQLRKFEEAVSEYLRAIELSPDYSTAFTNLGQAYMMMNNWNEAEQNLLKAVSLDDEDFHANESLAKLYMIRGDGVQAEIYWKRSYVIKPEPGQLVNLAHCLILQKKLDEALEVLNRALPEEEENPRLFSLLGIIYFARYDFGSAIRCFKRSLGFTPEDAEVRHNLAMALLRTSQSDEAVNELRRILLLNPDHTEARNNLAVIELSAGDTESAMIHFNITLDQEPQNAKALYYKGAILVQKGETGEAEIILQKTIATNHEDYKLKAKQLLDSIKNSI